MKQILDKFVSVERSVSDERGPFALFALFLREDMNDRWDFVVAAPWLHSNSKDDLEYLAEQVTSQLDPNEVVFLSRIVVIDMDNPGLEEVRQAFHIEHGRIEMKDRDFFGLRIQHAHIITSQSGGGSRETAAPQAS